MIDDATRDLLRRALEAVADGRRTALRECVEAIGAVEKSTPGTRRELLPLSITDPKMQPQETRSFYGTVQMGPFFPQRLFVAPSIARYFAIEDLRIGKNSLHLGPGSTPAELYSSIRRRGAAIVHAETMQVGMQFSAVVTNIGKRPHPWIACVFGVT